MNRFFVLASILAASSAGAAADGPLLRAGDRGFQLAEARALFERLPPIERQADSGKAVDARALVERVMAPYFRYSLYAADHLKGNEQLRREREALLARAVEADLRRGVTVTDSAVQAYYQEHASQFTTTEGLLLSRILVNTEAQAKTLINSLKSEGGLKSWGKFTREHSADSATKYRDGSLGFVRSDGSTDVPQVRANRALFEAAKQVADGELVPTPVREGEYFAVLWRRGTRLPETRTLESARRAIYSSLERALVSTARTTLLATLRAQHLSELHVDAIEAIEYPKDPGIPLPKVPLVPRAAAVKDRPQATERGER